MLLFEKVGWWNESNQKAVYDFIFSAITAAKSEKKDQFLTELLDYVKGFGERPPSLWRVEEMITARLKDCATAPTLTPQSPFHTWRSATTDSAHRELLKRQALKEYNESGDINIREIRGFCEGFDSGWQALKTYLGRGVEMVVSESTVDDRKEESYRPQSNQSSEEIVIVKLLRQIECTVAKTVADPTSGDWKCEYGNDWTGYFCPNHQAAIDLVKLLSVPGSATHVSQSPSADDSGKKSVVNPVAVADGKE